MIQGTKRYFSNLYHFLRLIRGFRDTSLWGLFENGFGPASMISGVTTGLLVYFGVKIVVLGIVVPPIFFGIALTGIIATVALSFDFNRRWNRMKKEHRERLITRENNYKQLIKKEEKNVIKKELVISKEAIKDTHNEKTFYEHLIISIEENIINHYWKETAGYGVKRSDERFFAILRLKQLIEHIKNDVDPTEESDLSHYQAIQILLGEVNKIKAEAEKDHQEHATFSFLNRCFNFTKSNLASACENVINDLKPKDDIVSQHTCLPFFKNNKRLKDVNVYRDVYIHQETLDNKFESSLFTNNAKVEQSQLNETYIENHSLNKGINQLKINLNKYGLKH